MTLSKKNILDIETIFKKYNKNLKEEEKIKLAKKFVNLFLDTNLKLSSKANKISLTKKFISNKIKDNTFTNNIIAPKDLTKKTFEIATERRRNKKIFEIKKTTLNKIFEFKKSDNIYEMIIYLLFVTGRRFNTILNNDFRNLKGTKKIEAKLLKKRNMSDQYFSFPVIGRKFEVLKIIKKFRKLYKLKKIKNISFNRQANKLIKIYLNDDNLNLRILRSLYALYLYKFKNKNKITINSFVSKVLCHESDQCSIHYTGLEILE